MGLPSPGAGTACLLSIAAIGLAGCGGGGSGTTGGAGPKPGTESVTIAGYAYRPANLTVPKGTTVTFTNRDSTPHTATSKQAGAFESGSIDPGKSAKVTLDRAGTFTYYCLFHPFMKGTIEVE